MDEGAESAFEPDHYIHLTQQFLERFQALLSQLDPIGLKRTKYHEFITSCLEAIDTFLGRLTEYLSEEHQALVADALFFSFKAHGLVLRKSKDALFFEHPLATADYLAKSHLDAPTLAAALLHDVVEDTKVPAAAIVKQFGAKAGELVEGVTKLQAAGKRVISQSQQAKIQVQSTNKLFRFMVDDVRVVLVKLADRRHNMQTISALSKKKQHEKSHEVLKVYAPLAYRLGMWDIKSELEELALETLRPELYAKLKELMERRAREHLLRLDVIRSILQERLEQAGLQNAWIEPAPEQVYTLYQDYEQSGRLPARLADTIRIVVLVEEQGECYQALGLVHELWGPVPGTFDDYIAQPRENLYQALHTTVFGPGGLLKVRFRTYEMHQIAQHGILARWSADISDQSKRFEGIQRLLERMERAGEIAESGPRSAAYREALTGQIHVFTPKGDLVELPAGSTPLDFAYQIHTKLGDEADRVYINGLHRPLNTPLQSGDQVNIGRREGKLPLREWLDEDLGFAHTMYAQSKIRQTFRRLKKGEALLAGREALQREMNMMGLDDYDLKSIAQQLNLKNVKQLLLAIARADLMPYAVAHLAMGPIWNSLEAFPTGDVVLSPDGPVTVRGVPGRPVKLCGSCRPVPGDAIVGDLLRGGQATVHRMDCRHVGATDQRGRRPNLVEVDWVKEPLTVRPVHICVAAVDRSGLAHDLTQILEREKVNICELYGRTDHNRHVGLVTLTVQVSNLRQLSRILHRFAQLPNVKAVTRFSHLPHYQDKVMEWAIKNI